jgi:hypothetical protein
MKWQLVVLFPRELRRLREWRSRLLQQAAGGALLANPNSEPVEFLIGAERNWESEV